MRDLTGNLAISLLWAFALPILGFLFFSMLTILPALGLFFLGPEKLLHLIYKAGFVPSLVTAVSFRFLARTRPLVVRWLITCAVGCLSAALWYFIHGVSLLDRFGYVDFALFAATVAACSMMVIIEIAHRKGQNPGSSPIH